MRHREIRRAIGEERHRLGQVLRGLDAGAWDGPSLVAGWTVRDVAGHLTSLGAYYRIVTPAPLVALRHGRRVMGHFDGLARQSARDNPVEALIAGVETVPWRHPWPVLPLSEVVIHGQDIRRPLGLGPGPAAGHLAVVADFLRVQFGPAARMSYPYFAGRRLRGLRFEASDHDWVGGEGLVVRGPLESIVLALAGRPVHDELEGPGVDRFRAV